MQMLQWVKANGLTVKALGREWGRDFTRLTRIFRGEAPPSFEVIVLAHQTTAGVVGVEDWIALNRPRLEADGIIAKPDEAEEAAK